MESSSVLGARMSSNTTTGKVSLFALLSVSPICVGASLHWAGHIEHIPCIDILSNNSLPVLNLTLLGQKLL